MSTRTSPTSPRTEWVPRGVDAWFVTLVSVATTIATAVLAYSTTRPVRWNRLGKLGAIALHFPLHLLAGTAVALLLVTVAVVFRARVAAWLFAVVMILTALMAVSPTAAIWRQARQWAVPLSLRYYIINAAHVNSGSPQLDRSVVYGITSDGTKLQLDVWQTGQPKAGPRRPAILIVHGNAWTDGNRSGSPDWNRWFNDLGYEVFDVEYRLPPPVRWLDEIGDVKSALGWIVSHATEYYVDPKRITVMGRSAGANLAMLAAYSMNDAKLPASTNVPAVAIRSVINLYGPGDLALLYRAGTSPDYTRPQLDEYIGGAPARFPDRFRELSPLSHITSAAPPTLTFLGMRDRLVSTEQATLLDAALSRANVPHETFLLPANDHGFDVNWGGFGTQIARIKIKSFLARFG